MGCGAPEYPGAYTRTSCYLGWIAEQFGMKAHSSPHLIGQDWSTPCPQENKIPPEWLSDTEEILDDDPDVEDALVIEGRDQIRKYYSSFLPPKRDSNPPAQTSGHISNRTHPLTNQPSLSKYFSSGSMDNKPLYFAPHALWARYPLSRYVWMPIRKHPLIIYPITHNLQYTYG